jgi:hypothetical protein
VAFGNLTAPPTRVYPSYRDTSYYYNGTTYNPLEPGPPCSAGAILFFPDSVSFGAAVRSEVNSLYGGATPDVTSLSLHESGPGKARYPVSSQWENQASFGIVRAQRDAGAVFGNPQQTYNPETPDLPPVARPPGPPPGPPPPPELPIVGRRK